MCLYNNHILFIHVRGGRAHSTIFFYFFLAPWETSRFGERWTAGASGFLSWSVGKKDARPGQGWPDGPEGSGTVRNKFHL